MRENFISKIPKLNSSLRGALIIPHPYFIFDKGIKLTSAGKERKSGCTISRNFRRFQSETLFFFFLSFLNQLPELSRLRSVFPYAHRVYPFLVLSRKLLFSPTSALSDGSWDRSFDILLKLLPFFIENSLADNNSSSLNLHSRTIPSSC